MGLRLRYIFFDDVEIDEGPGLGSLTDHTWGYGDNDSLGYDTVYVRDDTGDPDSSGVIVTASLIMPLLPSMSDNLIQAFKSISNPVGNAVALLVGFQDSSTSDNTNQVWAMNMGVSNYADANHSIFYGMQQSYRLDNNNHTVGSLSLYDGRFTMAGGNHASSKSNLGALTFFAAQTSREGGDIASTTTTMTLFKDNTAFDWDVTNFYGLYIADHSAYVSGDNWGIYNLSPSYFGGDVTIAGNLFPLRTSDNSEPTLDSGEIRIWRDADDNQVWLCYNDADEGQVKVELT